MSHPNFGICSSNQTDLVQIQKSNGLRSGTKKKNSYKKNAEILHLVLLGHCKNVPDSKFGHFPLLFCKELFCHLRIFSWHIHFNGVVNKNNSNTQILTPKYLLCFQKISIFKFLQNFHLFFFLDFWFRFHTF